MSQASNLIERAEQEAGCRWDDPDNPNALATIFGAVAREMGISKFGPEDDFAVGTVIADEVVHGERRQRDALLRDLLLAGLSPDDIANLT